MADSSNNRSVKTRKSSTKVITKTNKKGQTVRKVKGADGAVKKTSVTRTTKGGATRTTTRKKTAAGGTKTRVSRTGANGVTRTKMSKTNAKGKTTRTNVTRTKDGETVKRGTNSAIATANRKIANNRGRRAEKINALDSKLAKAKKNGNTERAAKLRTRQKNIKSRMKKSIRAKKSAE